MSDPKLRIVLGAGGTGGHIFPAQALAQELGAQGHEVFIFTDGRGHQFADTLHPPLFIPASHLQGGVVRKAKGALSLLKGIGVAFTHLRDLKPHAVVGFGGYASFPTLIAAFLLRIPTVIHQADAYFGRVNRILSPFATHIATSFPAVKKIPSFCAKKVTFTGLPIRSDIKTSPYHVSEGDDPFHLLITGGSQGAKVFGEIVPEAVGLLDPALQRRLSIAHQCRAEYKKATEGLYAKTKAAVELSPFLDKMGERYKKAHLVISRAGASSVVEVALARRPALFVPYPYAMDDHQFYNAQQATLCGGGWMVREKDFTPQKLADFLAEWMVSPRQLKEAAVNVQRIAVPNASVKLANLVNSVVNFERINP